MNITNIESLMKSNGIMTMAQGVQGEEIKFFFHCQFADKTGYAMAEIKFNTGHQMIGGIVKSTIPEAMPRVIAKFDAVLEPISFK